MTATTSSLHLPAGSTAAGAHTVHVTPESAGWGHTGLRILRLAAGESQDLETGPDEFVLVPLEGSFDVECDGKSLHLAGRASVFAGPSDVVYLPRDATARLTGGSGGPPAPCTARARPPPPGRDPPPPGGPAGLR